MAYITDPNYYSIMGTGITTTNTTITPQYPLPHPYSLSVNIPLPPEGQIQFFITPVKNGFLVGKGSPTQHGSVYIKDHIFCKNYQEISEAIISILALNQILDNKE